jgi:cellulose synthase/poly-beta-1,6-N-acetylglucosamine synthase-like glycosyltransferase
MLLKIFLVKFFIVFVLALYGIALLFIFLYSLAQAGLIIRYLRSNRKNKNKPAPEITDDQWPHVTVQLPVFNEMYVVERLIDAVAEFDYPKTKLEIQVLDDSTDETVEIVKTKVTEWKNRGFDICQIRRTVRSGFKAGALEEGLRTAKGEFIAVFDADFVPANDFLTKTIPHFADKKTGVVQTRWGHLNRDYSLLTELQAFGLDAHFTVEQVGRNEGGCFINFNGTAGVWRKECILDAGNWESDTLTEDLDLSYRAQLKGWKFIFLENIESPAELPPVISALRSQQYRWTKGGAEVARKHIGKIIRQKLPLSVKWHAIMHLLNSAVFVSIITCAILSVPLLFIKQHYPQHEKLLFIASFFMLSLLVVGGLYLVTSFARKAKGIKGLLYFFKTFPLFLSVSMGLSLHNGIAVLEGYMGRKSPFIRTPKFNQTKQNEAVSGNRYVTRSWSMLTMLEGLLMLYFLGAIFVAIYIGDYGLLPFHLMLTVGFGVIFGYSIIHSRYNSNN